MPIRADLRKFYGREWKLGTRPRILARDGYRCTACGRRLGALYLNRHGKAVVVQLGVAHLNGEPRAGESDAVLATLCRACHLRFDAGFHRASRSARKDSARPLLAALEATR